MMFFLPELPGMMRTSFTTPKDKRMKHEMKDDLKDEMKDEMKEEMKDEIKDEVKDEVKDEMKEPRVLVNFTAYRISKKWRAYTY